MFHKIKSNPVHMLIMDQINDVENCMIQFESFVRASCASDVSIETLRSLSDGIAKAEAVADVSLRKMIDSLAGGNFLPSTRQDLISIATSCDAVANRCEVYSKMSVYQHFTFPESYADALMEIIAISHKQFDLLEKSISRLFSDMGALMKDHSILDDIRVEESKVDLIEQKLNEKTFALDIGLAEKMQMSTFIENICDISDVIENIADKIQIMLVTRKA